MSDFLQMSLNRMSGIRDTAGRIADRRTGKKEAARSRMYDAFKSLGNKFESQRERDFASDEAAKLAEAKLMATGQQQGLDLYAAGENERVIKDAEQRMLDRFKDKSYTCPITDKTYHWDTAAEFEMAIKSMQRNLDLYLAAQSKSDEDGNYDNKFLEIIGSLGAGTFTDSYGYDENGKPVFTWDWTDDNKKELSKAFEAEIGYYDERQKGILRGQLQMFMEQRSFETVDPEKPKAEGIGFKWPWTDFKWFDHTPMSTEEANALFTADAVDPEKSKAEGIGFKWPRTGDHTPMSTEEANTASSLMSGTNYGLNPVSRQQAIDVGNTLLPGTEETPIRSGTSTIDKILSLLSENPSPETRSQRQELSSYMSEMKAGNMNESALNRFLTFLKSIK